MKYAEKENTGWMTIESWLLQLFYNRQKIVCWCTTGLEDCKAQYPQGSIVLDSRKEDTCRKYWMNGYNNPKR